MDKSEDKPTRCAVCYLIYKEPDMDEALKQKLREWDHVEEEEAP